MTPAARARLEEVMARRLCRWRSMRACSFKTRVSCDNGCTASMLALEENGHMNAARATIDAALAAGFVISEPDDGR